MKWNLLPADELVRRLEPPKGRVKMVLDTDTYNEVDDQFALAYSLLSPEKLDVLAVYAAPYFNDRSSGPEDGMEKSYAEIVRLLGKMGRTSEGFVFKGSRGYLPDGETPVESEAARDKDALRADHADAGNAQQRFVIRAVDLDREEVGVPQRPAALGIEQRVEVRLAFVEQLAGAKAVEPQQPVRLIESVLAQKRRLGIQRR